MKKTINAFERLRELGIITEDEKQNLIEESKDHYKQPKASTKIVGRLIKDFKKAYLMTIHRNKKDTKGKPRALWVPKKLILKEYLRSTVGHTLSKLTVTVPNWYVDILKTKKKL